DLVYPTVEVDVETTDPHADDASGLYALGTRTPVDFVDQHTLTVTDWGSVSKTDTDDGSGAARRLEGQRYLATSGPEEGQAAGVVGLSGKPESPATSAGCLGAGRFSWSRARVQLPRVPASVEWLVE